MRQLVVAAVMLVALPLGAQQPTGTLPAPIAADVARLLNAPAARSAVGSLSIAPSDTVQGDVSVLDGTLTIGGRITGRALVVNGDAVLLDGATIDGDLIVVGGAVRGQERANVRGATQRYPERFRYHRDADRVVADLGAPSEQPRNDIFQRWRNFREHSPLTVYAYGGPYNRVEGMPIAIGPQLTLHNDLARLRIDALGIVRSSNNFDFSPENRGHDVRAELQLGASRAIRIGGRLYDVVDPTERWQLRDGEVGLAAFFFHRDYRDYFNRHGGGGYITVPNGHGARLTLGLADEIWGDRRDHAPFTVFENDDAWRPNPIMDEGRFHIATATLEINTRDSDESPRTGWWITTDLEYGTSNAATRAPTSPTARGESGRVLPVEYTRAFLDLRRYNRLSPLAQLNVRAVLGGWVGGDPLPLQRRFSLGGAGTLPGFDFRSPGRTDKVDVLTCSSDGVLISGMPAQCERMALAQIEYRYALGVHVRTGKGDIDDWLLELDRAPQLVVFADAGRGWLVGPERVGSLQYGSNQFPSVASFQSDVGLGLDFDFIGVFLAKATSVRAQPANVFVRLRHRF